MMYPCTSAIKLHLEQQSLPEQYDECRQDLHTCKRQIVGIRNCPSSETKVQSRE
ncbi:hypothetical protein KC19_3G242300 [Ceratodon purpureus]|uniref:Uncharacterized protein n=1 Tax=Ceratodon purpureus TaxID=3225 RepID=A0A8T0INW6_CERPU|nr:hypothetical protein KC19_3G242300 [Ceratodon purpureus]